MNQSIPKSKNIVEKKIGRLVGSTNRKYERDVERTQSLRKLPSRNLMMINTVSLNYNEAIKDEHNQLWKEAMEKEFS